MKSLTVDFFLGANTQDGFTSHFEQLQNPKLGYQLYVIKGSAGSGKSTMMKKVEDEFSQQGGLYERIHCSSDPDSLDGVILHEQKTSILDGTPPHIVEPMHAGAIEQIVSFYDAFNQELLQQRREQIVKFTAENSTLHRRFCELLKGVNLLLDSNKTILSPYLDHEKINKTIHNILKREIKPPIKKTGVGTGQVRLLSAFTPKGIYTYESTIQTLCEKIYLLQDEHQVCTDLFMRIVKKIITEKGYDCYVCYSPFHAADQLQHLLIPALSLGFVSKNHFIPLEQIHPYRVVNGMRFYTQEILKKKKQRLRFCKKTATTLLEEGLKTMSLAKSVHDELEQTYNDAVDFKVVHQIGEQLIQKIKMFSPQHDHQS